MDDGDVGGCIGCLLVGGIIFLLNVIVLAGATVVVVLVLRFMGVL